MAICFDGTAFGTEEMSDEVPTIVSSLTTLKKTELDTEIPF
jgi:hypothetical protein